MQTRMHNRDLWIVFTPDRREPGERLYCAEYFYAGSEPEEPQSAVVRSPITRQRSKRAKDAVNPGPNAASKWRPDAPPDKVRSGTNRAVGEAMLPYSPRTSHPSPT